MKRDMQREEKGLITERGKGACHIRRKERYAWRRKAARWCTVEKEEDCQKIKKSYMQRGKKRGQSSQRPQKRDIENSNVLTIIRELNSRGKIYAEKSSPQDCCSQAHQSC